jgi:hypothetical protein
MRCLRRRPLSAHAPLALWVLLFAPLALALVYPSLLAAQAGPAGSIHGTLLDPSGGAVTRATVQVVSAAGATLTATTNGTGGYNLNNVPAGTYTIQVNVTGFAPYEKDMVVIPAGGELQLDISLTLQQQQEQVTVSGDALTLNTTASSNASQVVITQQELDALPDDPDELQADLESLAGPGAGPNGGQMYIDGFTAGELPPKASIREIRINSDPFSAEYDQVGFGRIEILTKPGGNAWHGSISENNNSAIFNTRNPFAATKGDFQSNQIQGNYGGGLGKHASLFFNADYRNISNSSVINAQIIAPSATDPSTFVQQPYQALYPFPQYRLNIGSRLDWQLATNNTLTVRFQYERNSETNSGVGNFTLPVQASNVMQTEDQVQITDTQYLGKRVVYETRFQYLHEPTNNFAANAIPSVSIPGAFTGGGSGSVLDLQNRYELQSYASIAFVKHFLKFGARIREVTDSNNSNSAFFGAFNFNNLTAYQTMIQGLSSGETMAQIIAGTGCNTNGISNGTCAPNQFSLTAGNPNAHVSLIDAGPFIEDDWKVLPNLTLSYGLRFETQNHIHDHADWAPRVSVAWGIGGNKTTPKYVLRTGWGVFYTRFDEQNTMQALRQNGVTEQQYIVTNPNFYCGPLAPGGTTLAGACPTPTQLSTLSASTPTIYQVSPNLHAPYLMQTSVSLERQLTKTVQVSATYNNARGEDQLLQANVNAPVLLGTQVLAPACTATVTTNCGVYPNGTSENIFQYESAGIFRQNQLFLNVTMRPSTGRILSRITLNGYYVLNYANSTPNTSNAFTGTPGGGAGFGGFVENPYDILGDYGRAGGRFGTRNSAFLLGTINLPHAIAFSPTFVVSSGAPYTVTLSKDLLGTSVLNQRPGVVSSATCPTTQITGANYCTPVGTFNSDPTAGEPIVPVNSLSGPSQFTLNLRLTKTFILNRERAANAQGGPNGGPGGRGGPGGGRAGFGGAGGGGGRPGGPGGGGGFGGPGGGGGRGGGAAGTRSFVFSINARNVFNRANLAAPVGTLTSPDFAQSESLSNVGPGGSVVANRQVYLQGTFNF